MAQKLSFACVKMYDGLGRMAHKLLSEFISRAHCCPFALFFVLFFSVLFVGLFFFVCFVFCGFCFVCFFVGLCSLSAIG